MFVFVCESFFSESLYYQLREQQQIPIVIFYFNYSPINLRDNIKRTIMRKNNFLTRYSKLKLDYFALQICFSTPLRDSSQIHTYLSNLKHEFSFIIGLGGLNKMNNFISESKNILFLQDPQNTFHNSKYDFIHHLNLGLNHISYKKLFLSKSFLFLSLNCLQPNIKGSREFVRISECLRLARKYKVPCILGFVVSSIIYVKTINELETIYHLFNCSTNFLRNSHSRLFSFLQLQKDIQRGDKVCEDFSKT